MYWVGPDLYIKSNSFHLTKYFLENNYAGKKQYFKINLSVNQTRMRQPRLWIPKDNIFHFLLRHRMAGEEKIIKQNVGNRVSLGSVLTRNYYETTVQPYFNFASLFALKN